MMGENYELPRIHAWILQNGFCKVALQFPDDMLVDAPEVALNIETTCKIDVYILGDTSYGSCCVDEITAQHVRADALIHFGRACLSQNKRLPVLYIFNSLKLDCDPFLSAFQETFIPEDTVIVASDLRYHQSLSELLPLLTTSVKVAYLQPDVAFCDRNSLPENSNLIISGRRCHLPSEHSQIESCKVLYVGNEDATLTNLVLSLSQCLFYTYNPKNHVIKEFSEGNRLLRKRQYLIEKARDATRIGILVATLCVSDYLEMIERTKSLILNAGKRCYTFVVGKLNPSKLANFPEIDCYTIIACPENSLLDSKEFYCPIITPFELEMALNSARTWTGYYTDFRQLLPGGTGYVEMEAEEAGSQQVISLVSGRLRTIGLESDDPASSEMGQLQARSKQSQLSTLPSGSDFLNLRTWKGLEPCVGDVPVPSVAGTGRCGLASGYQGEGTADGQRGDPDGQD